MQLKPGIHVSTSTVLSDAETKLRPPGNLNAQQSANSLNREKNKSSIAEIEQWKRLPSTNEHEEYEDCDNYSSCSITGSHA